LLTMATPATMEVLSLGTTFGNEWETLWREWLSTLWGVFSSLLICECRIRGRRAHYFSHARFSD
jgi:hypothetical protein